MDCDIVEAFEDGVNALQLSVLPGLYLLIM